MNLLADNTNGDLAQSVYIERWGPPGVLLCVLVAAVDVADVR